MPPPLSLVCLCPSIYCPSFLVVHDAECRVFWILPSPWSKEEQNKHHHVGAQEPTSIITVRYYGCLWLRPSVSRRQNRTNTTHSVT